MRVTTYKILALKVEGTAYAVYQDGWLTMLISEMTHDEHLDFPLREKDLLDAAGFWSVQHLAPKSVADKVALFCIKYKQHKNLTYRAAKEEKANLKLVTVNEQLLDAYFTHVNYPLNTTKSMADYVRHYNTVRDLATHGAKPRGGFPDVPDSEYEKTLSPEKLSAYRLHLVQLGWKKVDGVWKQTK